MQLEPIEECALALQALVHFRGMKFKLEGDERVSRWSVHRVSRVVDKWLAHNVAKTSNYEMHILAPFSTNTGDESHQNG